MVRRSALLIAGPTASGKSALAADLAQRFDGTIINADSMQVYADLRVLTARPTVAEEAVAPHLLFGHVDGAMNYSVGRWLADVSDALAATHASGRLPVLVGGTGMYFKALLRGLSDIPAVPDAVRQSIRASAEGLPPEALHARLAARDPLTAARLRPSDPQRILRALEVFEATGEPLAHFQTRRGPALLDASRCLAVFLSVDRRDLFARIDGRFDAMLADGAIAEVEALAARSLDPALPVMRAHGVPGLIAWLEGRATLDAARQKGQTDTRHYAKRQETFVRHQLPEFGWLSPADAHRVAMEWAEGEAMSALRQN